MEIKTWADIEEKISLKLEKSTQTDSVICPEAIPTTPVPGSIAHNEEAIHVQDNQNKVHKCDKKKYVDQAALNKIKSETNLVLPIVEPRCSEIESRENPDCCQELQLTINDQKSANAEKLSNYTEQDSNNRAHGMNYKPIICHGCGLRGHYLQQCRYRKIKCFKCAKIGHLSWHCKAKIHKQQELKQKSPSESDSGYGGSNSEVVTESIVESSDKETNTEPMPHTPASSHDTENEIQKTRNKLCNNCGRTGHVLRQCRYVLCNNCFKRGHIRRDCTVKRRRKPIPDQIYRNELENLHGRYCIDCCIDRHERITETNQIWA